MLSSATTAAPKAPAVYSALDLMANQVTRVSELVAEVERRLSPVLADDSGTSKKEPVVPTTSVPIAMSIHAQASTLVNAGDVLDAILRRIEV